MKMPQPMEACGIVSTWKACAITPIRWNSVMPVWPISGWMMLMRARLEARPVFEHRAPLLAERERPADGARHLRLALHVLGRAGRLGEVEIVLLQPADDADRFAGGELPVQVDAEVDVRADRLAQRRHLLHDAVVRHRGGELDGPEALAHPLHREVAALLQGRLGQSRDIGGQGVVAASAEQGADGQVRRLAEQVPDARCRRPRGCRRSSRPRSRARASGRRGPRG